MAGAAADVLGACTVGDWLAAGAALLLPDLPVYGLTFPFVLQLSAFVWFGADRSCGGTYFPDLVV